MEREQRVERRKIYEGKAQLPYTARLSPQETAQLTDRFALLQLFKNFYMWEEFKVNGEWTAGVPKVKIEERRIAFPGIDNLNVALDSYAGWQAVQERKVDSPVNPEEVFRRLTAPRIRDMILAQLGAPGWFLDKDPKYAFPYITLFVPWGVRPQGEFGEPEENVMGKIRSLKDTLDKSSLVGGKKRIYTKVLIMPADLYATEVNNQMDPKIARGYFSQVAKEARRMKFEVKPWSEIRSENQERYQSRAAELTKDELIRILGREYVEEAVETARRRSGYRKEQDIVNAALAYLRERICEAEIVEDVYKPIKVSAVTKGKDNRVDRDLPRIYIIPPELRFPWLKVA